MKAVQVFLFKFAVLFSFIPSFFLHWNDLFLKINHWNDVQVKELCYVFPLIKCKCVEMFISYNNNDDNECIQVNRIEQNSLLCIHSAPSPPGVDGANANSQFSSAVRWNGVMDHRAFIWNWNTHTHNPQLKSRSIPHSFIHSSVTSHSRTFSFIIIISFSIILMTKITWNQLKISIYIGIYIF